MEDIEDDDDGEEEEERRKKAEEDAKKDSKAVVELKEEAAYLMKKYKRDRQDILDCQKKIEEHGHTDMFHDRQVRLKADAKDKLKKLSLKLQKLKAETLELELVYPPTREAIVHGLDLALRDIEKLVRFETIKDYDNEVAAEVAESERLNGEKKNADLLLQFT